MKYFICLIKDFKDQIPLKYSVNKSSTLNHLKLKIKDEFNIDIEKQFWILENKQTPNENVSVFDLLGVSFLNHVTNDFEICVHLLPLNETNLECKFFDCEICLEKNLKVNSGLILSSCSHIFCKDCFKDYILNSNDLFNIKCAKCDIGLFEKDIKSVLNSNELAKFQQNQNNQTSFTCSRRKIHSNEASCDEALSSSRTDSIENLVNCGLIMRCPNCSILIEKEDKGCQAVRCFFCKVDICWLTKQRRWGPGGKGDISDGCRCGVNGIKCHPDCQNCH